MSIGNFYKAEKTGMSCATLPERIEDKMIFQNRGQFDGQVGRIGVLLGTSSPRYVKMTRF